MKLNYKNLYVLIHIYSAQLLVGSSVPEQV